MLGLAEKYEAFSAINAGYDAVFTPGRLSIGLVVPIETYANGPVPSMEQHVERVRTAEALGFSAVWLRDVPFNVPSFGDAGQIFDPFVYLGALAAQTSNIALGVASIVLPLRHPAHVAKAAATVDVLSNGRLILGIASGDRPEEYPALDVAFAERGELFRESYEYIRQVAKQTPSFGNSFGRVAGGIDMLPKPKSGRLPLLLTGSSQQSNDWIAANGDGWMTYPRPADQQSRLIEDYRASIRTAGCTDKPVMEPLYLSLAANPDTPPSPIHLGIRTGINPLRDYLRSREEIGVNHVALNLRFNGADTESTLEKLADQLIPEFTF
ncbi:MAG: LLM class oxidoreductase [Woeseiaceae bacterium]